MNNQQVNLVTLLQKILDQSQSGPPGCVNITPDDRQFIEQYLYGDSIELHAQASFETSVSHLPRPVKEHFFVKGDRVDIFTLLQSMAQKSPQFASVLCAAGDYVYDQIPFCNVCKMRHMPMNSCGKPNEWNFSNNNQTTNDEQQKPNPPAPAGGL